MDTAAEVQPDAAIDGCGICGEGFQADQKTCQLLCDHTFHTECMFREATRDNYIADVRCHTCQQRIITTEIYEDMQALNQGDMTTDTIKDVFESSAEFREDIVKLKEKHKAVYSDWSAFSKAKREVITAHKASVATLIDTLKYKIKATKQTLMNMAEYKQLKRASTNYVAFRTRFREKWGMSGFSMWRLRRSIMDLRGTSEYAVPKYIPPEHYSRYAHTNRRFRDLYVCLN
jgi:hypothetical protein